MADDLLILVNRSGAKTTFLRQRNEPGKSHSTNIFLTCVVATTHHSDTPRSKSGSTHLQESHKGMVSSRGPVIPVAAPRMQGEPLNHCNTEPVDADSLLPERLRDLQWRACVHCYWGSSVIKVLLGRTDV